jgi:hypothetical protein
MAARSVRWGWPPLGDDDAKGSESQLVIKQARPDMDGRQ